MKQPLMLTPARIPPAQAEALYDASLAGGTRPTAPAMGDRPGEDWEGDLLPTQRAQPPPGPGQARTAQH